MGKRKNLGIELVARPMFRMAICSLVATAWFILSVLIFQVYLPQFAYYNTLIKAQGTTSNDVWFIWAWIPVLLLLVVGIFWSSGILGIVGKAISRV